MKKHRVITVVLAIFNLVLALYLLDEFQWHLRAGAIEIPKEQWTFLPLPVNIHNGFLILLLVLSVTVVIGIIVKRNWGRMLALFQCVLFIVFGVYLFWIIFRYITHWGDPLGSVFLYEELWAGILWIMYSIAEWIYLTRPNVRAIFKTKLSPVSLS